MDNKFIAIVRHKGKLFDRIEKIECYDFVGIDNVIIRKYIDGRLMDIAKYSNVDIKLIEKQK